MNGIKADSPAADQDHRGEMYADRSELDLPKTYAMTL